MGGDVASVTAMCRFFTVGDETGQKNYQVYQEVIYKKKKTYFNLTIDYDHPNIQIIEL